MSKFLKIIRKKCLECSGESPKEVAECRVPDCVLFPYRMGNDPQARRRGRINSLASVDGKLDTFSVQRGAKVKLDFAEHEEE